MKRSALGLAALVLAMGLGGCGGGDAVADPAPEPEAAASPTLAPGAFPASLAAMGDGFPNAGDPCRALGESEVTSNWLDDSAQLVGCPTRASADRLGGSIVETVDGFYLVSVPRPKPEGEGDALVQGTDFNATATISCAIGDAPPGRCDAGVKRKWGEDGTTLVEITRPDGGKRALFFRGDEAYGADSAQADGSAGWDFDVRRRDDSSIVTFGPERYVIPDVFVLGD